ncbi:MAG: penicillin-binding protein [Clostridiales bacterium]|nr:penicillin-binding protein [Clostridiales bacterium]
MNNPFDPSHIQEEKAEREARRLRLRTNLLIALFCTVLAGFFAVLYQTQVVNGASYLVNSDVRSLQPEGVDSVRGEILDRYGRVLVTNEVSYNVELDWDAMGADRLSILTRLLAICREEGVEWADSLPISKTAPWTYTTDTPFYFQTEVETDDGGTELKTTKTSLGRLAEKEKCGWIKDATKAQLTAGKLLATMCQSFGIIEKENAPRPKNRALTGTLAAAGQAFGLTDEGGGVTRADRDLAGVLYELYLRQCEVSYSTYVFARGVDITFISKVKEFALDGVRVEVSTARKYNTSCAAHVLGYTGAITQDSAEYYKELGYPMNATVGREGAELAFEGYLHGSSGTRLLEKDKNGNIISQEWQTQPEPGGNVVLTIDSALQATVEDLLAQYAAEQEEAGGMAAAVVDMTGGALALASYPTYDLSTFWENYSELANDNENKPLYNRATQGLYAPGSTFKMLTAVAALSTETITTRETVTCTGVYTHYPTPQPACWIWNSLRGTHGRETVTQAITDSCNIFFYDVGRRTGIAALQEYASKFGLGEYTGIEIAEKKGWMAGPDTSAHFGQTWYEGNTMFAAIGQENNQFTPLQIANYVATLANGGSHYKAHLLKEVKSSDYSRVAETYEPELLNTIDIDEKELDAVLQGMYNLSQTSNMARHFSSLPVTVGCKTGTSQVAAKTANAVFVCFAPYDDPQIALCLVAEQGASGSSLAQLAAGILAQYFSTGRSLTAVPSENTLLR